MNYFEWRIEQAEKDNDNRIRMELI